MTMSGFSTSRFTTDDDGIGPIRGRPPEALLWLNPFAAQYDVICGASDGYGGWCTRLSTITNGAISVGIGGGGTSTDLIPGTGTEGGFDTGNAPPEKAVIRDVVGPDRVVVPGPVVVNDVVAAEPQAFGIRRDRFWPRSVAAWLVVSLGAIVLSIQLVSPTRRWRLPVRGRPSRRIA
jgi:hypothetical protein